jgi:hypothetical protein
MACRRTTARRPPAPRALKDLRELGFYDLSAQHCGDRVFLHVDNHLRPYTGQRSRGGWRSAGGRALAFRFSA